MVWLLLSVMLLMLVMELRVWRAVARLIYRTGRDRFTPANQKD